MLVEKYQEHLPLISGYVNIYEAPCIKNVSDTMFAFTMVDA